MPWELEWISGHLCPGLQAFEISHSAGRVSIVETGQAGKKFWVLTATLGALGVMVLVVMFLLQLAPCGPISATWCTGACLSLMVNTTALPALSLQDRGGKRNIWIMLGLPSVNCLLSHGQGPMHSWLCPTVPSLLPASS